MSSPSHNLVADAFVAGSLQQAVFALNGSYGIIDGPDAEPRAARANDIHLFRHAAFEIRPAHPDGLPVSIDALKHLLQEEVEFFQGLDGLLVGMDPDMSIETRSRSIARADRILACGSAVAFRIRTRFLFPANGQEWDPQGALELAVEQGSIHAAACYRPLADGAVDRAADDIAVTVLEEYGPGVEAADSRDRILRSGLVGELARIEVDRDRNAAANLAFRAADYPDLGALGRSRHMLAALGQRMLRRLASPSPMPSEEISCVADVTGHIDPILEAAESIAAGNSGSRRGDAPAKAYDLDAIQSQIAWIGDQLSSGEVGRAEQAIEQLIRRQAERSRPSDVVKTLTAVADLARRIGYLELTRRLLSAIDIAGHADAAAQCVRASLLGDEGCLDEAFSVLDEAIGLFPDDVVPRTARAEALRALGRSDEALEALDETIVRFPDNVVARNARAETLRALGRPDEALAALDETIVRFPDDVVARNARAETLRALGRPDEALAALDETIVRFPDDVVARNARAETLRALGRPDEALAALDETIVRFPDDVVARTARAETLRALGRPNEALEALDETIVRFPDNVVARNARAETLRALGRPDEALAALDETIVRFPDNVVARTARAETLRALGRPDEALAALDETIVRFPDDVVARTARAETLRALGRPDEALAALDETIVRFPDNVVARTARAETLRALGRPNEALAALDETIVRFPDDVVARTARAETLRALGRPDEALAALDETIVRFPDNVVARNARAETLRALGRPDEALAALDETIVRFPDDVVARNARAETLRALGRPDEALAALDETIVRFPDDVVARTARAETLRALGRPDEALAALKQTIERFPDNVWARNTYAHHLVILGESDRAVAILSPAAARPKTRGDWVAKHILAMALLRTGRFNDAYASLDDGVKRCPFIDVQVYFRTARPIARLAARQAAEAVAEFEVLAVDTTLSGTQATNVILLRAHAFAEIGDRERARQLIDEAATVINFEEARQQLAGALRQRYGLGEGEAASGVLADRLDERITGLEIDIENPLRLAA